MSYKDTPYFHVGRASDLVGKDRILYRFLEMVPGILSVGSLILTVFLSAFYPFYAAIFIIAFDLYWLLKTLYLSAFLRRNWKRLKHNRDADWKTKLAHFKYDHLYLY
jgi:hypothetical protein